MSWIAPPIVKWYHRYRMVDHNTTPYRCQHPGVYRSSWHALPGHYSFRDGFLQVNDFVTILIILFHLFIYFILHFAVTVAVPSRTSAQPFLESSVLLFWILGTLGFYIECNIPLHGHVPLCVLFWNFKFSVIGNNCEEWDSIVGTFSSLL